VTLFKLAPRDSPTDLGGRDRELSDLVRIVDSGRWVEVLGRRMVGKTSLIKAANQRLRRPSRVLEARPTTMASARQAEGNLAAAHCQFSSHPYAGSRPQSILLTSVVTVARPDLRPGSGAFLDDPLIREGSARQIPRRDPCRQPSKRGAHPR
jgi:hypothetical protein